MVVYFLAGALLLVGLYLLVLLLEADRMNRETPNQEDPMVAEDEER